MLGPVEKSLVFSAMFLLMVGMGSTLAWQDFSRIFRKPKGVCVGLLIQFGWMPLLAYIVSRLLDLPTGAAVVLLLVGCTPGGSSSNMYTWFAKGNVSLSLSMTIGSTLAAVVMTPLLVALYASHLDLVSLSIPYKQIVLSMSFSIVPVAMGMFLAHRGYRRLPLLRKLGGAAGVLATILMMWSWLPKMLDQFLNSPSKEYLAIFLLGNCGFFFGLLTAKFFGLGSTSARTISLETGLQNTLLTYTIITISFPEAFVSQYGWIPLVYGASIMGVGAFWVLGYWMTLSNPAPPPPNHDLSPWQIFVLRHRHPLNIFIHFLSALMFYLGPAAAIYFWDWRWLILFFSSGAVGTFGHWVSKDSSVNLREATASIDAVRFSTKMAWLVVSGRYDGEVSSAERKARHEGIRLTNQKGAQVENLEPTH